MDEQGLFDKLIILKKEQDGELPSKLICGEVHEAADRFLLQFINSKRITEAFLNIQRWYE